jgi:hypothetical protein
VRESPPTTAKGAIGLLLGNDVLIGIEGVDAVRIAVGVVQVLQ